MGGKTVSDQRYYSSGTGRFLSGDRHVDGTALRNPQGWNRYAYVQNDPVNFHDPDGLMMKQPDCTCFEGGCICTGGAPDLLPLSVPYDPYFHAGNGGPLEPVAPVLPRDPRGGGAPQSPEDEARGYLPGAINAAGRALDNPECGGLFGGGAAKAMELLAGLKDVSAGDGEVGVIQFGAIRGDAYTEGRPGTEVKFADGTTLYERVDISINSSRGGSKFWNQVGDVGRARILLHELGHVANLFVRGSGSKSREPDPAGSSNQAFNQSLEEKCFK